MATTTLGSLRTESSIRAPHITWYGPLYWILGTAAIAVGVWAVNLGVPSGYLTMLTGAAVAVGGSSVTRKVVAAGKSAITRTRP